MQIVENLDGKVDQGVNHANFFIFQQEYLHLSFINHFL